MFIIYCANTMVVHFTIIQGPVFSLFFETYVLKNKGSNLLFESSVNGNRANNQISVYLVG